MASALKFDFDYGDYDSEQLLAQVRRELLNLKASMGASDAAPADADVRATEAYFASLQDGKVAFPDAAPTVFPLSQAFFEKNQLPVPKGFRQLSGDSRFYWVEVPILLVHGQRRFYKLQVIMNFGEGVDDQGKLPTIHSAFPTSEFAQQAAINGKVELGVGQNFEFDVALGIDKIALPAVVPIEDASAGGKFGANAKLMSDLGLVLGPFSYTAKRALVDCRYGGEEVYWIVKDKQSLIEENPVFFVVLRVPKAASEVNMTARLRAHRDAPIPAFFARVLDLLSPKSADWLKKGAPITLRPYVCTIDTTK